MLKLLLIALSICLVCTQDYQPPEFGSCSGQLQVTPQPVDIYGTLNVFFSIAKGISDGLQKSMNKETLKDIYNYINQEPDHKSTGTIVNDVLKTQAGAIAFFCFGLLIILISLILGFSVCCFRCCCNACGADKKADGETSRWPAFLYIFTLVAAFSFILTAIIIFNQSAVYLYNSIDQSEGLINTVVSDLSNVLTEGTRQMTCSINESVQTTFNNLEVNMVQYPPTTITLFFNITGLTALQQFDMTALENQITTTETLGQQCTADLEGLLNDPKIAADPEAKSEIGKMQEMIASSLQTMQASLVVVKAAEAKRQEMMAQVFTETNGVQEKMNETIASTISAMQASQTGLASTINQINAAVNDAMESVTSIQNAINDARDDIDTWPGYGPVKASVRAAMSLPNAIALLFVTVVTVILIIRVIVQTIGSNSAERSGLAVGGGWFSYVGFYFVIFLTWMAMGITSVAFIGGWSVSGICLPMFEDNSFEVYGLIDSLNFNVDGIDGTQHSITTQQILRSCYENSTLYTAFNGTSLINVQMMDNKLNLTDYESQLDQQIDNANLDIPINPESVTAMKDQSEIVAKDSKGYTDMQNPGGFLPISNEDDPDTAGPVVNELNDFSASLALVSSQMNNFTALSQAVLTSSTNMTQIKTQLKAQSNESFNQVNQMVNDSTQALVTQLSDVAFNCYPLYEIFDHAGSIICDRFGRPMHGVWASAGLAAIFFIPVAIVLLCASCWLFRTSRNYKSVYVSEDECATKKEKSKEKAKAQRAETSASAPLEDDVFVLPPISQAAPIGLNRVYPEARVSNPWLLDEVANPWPAARVQTVGLQRTADPIEYGYGDSVSRGGGLRRADAPQQNWDAEDSDGESLPKWSSSALRRV